MTFREYRHDSDLPAVQRIWEECGWAEGEDDKAAMRHFFAVGESLVATIDDEPECVVHSTPGTVRYQDETLSLGAVTAVTTSRVARKLGFARQLTARMLARQAEQGMAVSALGMFEQGFYNLVGFGTGSYENWISFDPASLNVDVPFRPPKRLTRKDFEAMHGALLNRRGGHGQMSLLPPEFMRAELELGENGFGLGYYDGADGTLSHFIWGEAKDEHGPYTIVFHAYRNTGQLMELLSLIRSLGDQVNSVAMVEFSEFQLQDLLSKPFRTRRSTQKGPHEQRSGAAAYWQMRLLSLEQALAATHLDGPGVRFNLELSDPVAESLDAASNWRGLSGSYTISLGEESTVKPGTSATLPTLKASVGAFSRLWFGVRPASSLAITDELKGEGKLLNLLDRALRLPQPHPGWDF